jgi:hypothetical protein
VVKKIGFIVEAQPKMTEHEQSTGMPSKKAFKSIRRYALSVDRQSMCLATMTTTISHCTFAGFVTHATLHGINSIKPLQRLIYRQKWIIRKSADWED